MKRTLLLAFFPLFHYLIHCIVVIENHVKSWTNEARAQRENIKVHCEKNKQKNKHNNVKSSFWLYINFESTKVFIHPLTNKVAQVHQFPWNYSMNGITCKKIPCYMCDWACRWCIAENTKNFWSYVKYFLKSLAVLSSAWTISKYNWN